MTLFDDPEPRAVFSDCGRFRYRLHRQLRQPTIDGWQRRVLFVMTNPSIADHEKPDPTTTRCIGFATALEASDLDIGNPFGLIATKSADLEKACKKAVDPLREVIGPENDKHLAAMASRAHIIIVAWGKRGTLLGRDRAVYDLLCRASDPRRIQALRLAEKTGIPEHPLYLPGSLRPVPWKGPR